MFLKTKTTKSTENYSDKVNTLKKELREADAIVLGAGAGLSTAAGFEYGGETFDRYFSDFRDTYGIKEMYSGGFYPFSTLEEYWGWWARHIYINRYMRTHNDMYQDLLETVKDTDYFVLTTNVDHQFQMAGFDKNRMFYTQGDYGLWQCKEPCHQNTYDNEEQVIAMLLATGFLIEKDDEYVIDMENKDHWELKIPSELIPVCPVCGKPMTMNLRCDGTFVQDAGWDSAQSRYEHFLHKIRGKKVLYLELGVGMNTPVIIKYPFWQSVYGNPKATYACLNYGEAYAPKEIQDRSICIDEDICKVLKGLLAE